VGEPVRRYGQIIGFATVPIAPGQHVPPELRYGRFRQIMPRRRRRRCRTRSARDQGIRLPTAVATRNYIGILTSVNCSACRGTRRRRVQEKNFTGDNPLADFPMSTA
jgi:altronate hydrolase